ncbi:unnamed protein product [Adineta ricciae]|uniref:Uncharacterized protein n=1 Tax=Adineta ricciae TaxID=249248 RepID=A0A814DRN1_ADIRI|nr:unnamed protein product [Adineta ricciae]
MTNYPSPKFSACQVNKSDAGSDPTIRQNPIGFLETELHWNPTRKIPLKIQEIHVSDPRPSESNAIPSPGFHRIRRIPVGSDKILYWIRCEASTKELARRNCVPFDSEFNFASNGAPYSFLDLSEEHEYSLQNVETETANDIETGNDIPDYYGTVGSGQNPAARNLLKSAKTVPESRRAVPDPTQISTDPVAGMIDLESKQLKQIFRKSTPK